MGPLVAGFHNVLVHGEPVGVGLGENLAKVPEVGNLFQGVSQGLDDRCVGSLVGFGLGASGMCSLSLQTQFGGDVAPIVKDTVGGMQAAVLTFGKGVGALLPDANRVSVVVGLEVGPLLVVGEEMAVALGDWACNGLFVEDVHFGAVEVESLGGLGVLLFFGFPRVVRDAMNGEQVSLEGPLCHGLVALGAVNFGLAPLAE